MSLVALTNFITITTSTGGNPNDLKPSTFQNGKYDQPIEGYEYLSFIYQGAARNRSGDNMEAALILANNEISMGYAKKAVDSKYHIRVDTFLMTTDFDKKLDDPVWKFLSMRMSKYDSFLHIDVIKYRKILKSIVL